MNFRTLTFRLYGAASRFARATRLTKPLRKYFGPALGRFAFSRSTDITLPSTIRGHSMYLASQGSYPPHGMAMDTYEKETTRLFEDFIKPGMSIIDVGAHVGYYSLLAARHAGPEGRVYAFEAEPSNFDLLTRNIELNEYQNVVASNCAISNRVGSSTLFLTGLDTGRHSIYKHDLPQSGTVEVNTTTLDAFMEPMGWPRIDLLKVDVEGAEIDVLEGMDQLLRMSESLNLIMELNPVLLQGAGASTAVLLERLAASGFSIHYVDEKKGILRLDASAQSSMASELLKSGGSVNLFCTRE